MYCNKNDKHHSLSLLCATEGIKNYLVSLQRYSGNDLHGVTAKVIDMPHHCMKHHHLLLVPLFVACLIFFVLLTSSSAELFMDLVQLNCC